MEVDTRQNLQDKKFDGLTYERKGGRDGNSQREDEFRFVTAQEVLVSDKAVAEDNKEDRRTKTLRMILWEILGTFYSPRSQPSNSQARDAGANNLKLEQTHHQKGDAFFQPLHNSDTIETVFENPDYTVTRSITCSLI
ncbi:hypothetical protein GH714_038084 [Hevea brasiliensis]|uniref:Meiosis-specific protein ASY3-like coiled-coil domain-containing protein n=1 Tax=Hevea brasiliensis TaxID=3981 RepID=A0A6A6LXC7_HEVBR|nr:hypothetical protein GH714_038084 [Hevea brasiliensis]